MAQKNFANSNSLQGIKKNIVQIFNMDSSLDELDLDSLNKREKTLLRENIFRLFISYCCADDELCLNKIIKQTEKALIMKALFRSNGYISGAATALGVKYSTLCEKVKRYDIHFEKRPV